MTPCYTWSLNFHFTPILQWKIRPCPRNCTSLTQIAIFYTWIDAQFDFFVPFKNVFSEAYTWLKKSRKHYPSSSDIWDFRREWEACSEELIRSFLLGSYRLDVQKKITLSTGETIALWSSRDALVLKVLTVFLQKWLNPILSKTCYHLKGHGGLKGAVNEVLKDYPKYRFFCKTDV